MFNLYFGNTVNIISTFLVLGVIVFSVITLLKQKEIDHWGRRVAILLVLGLLVCVIVAIRDNYHLSVKNMTDPNIEPGVFTADSVQSTVCSLGGAIIAFCSLSSIFIRKQGYLKAMFYIMSATFIVKTLVIEIKILTCTVVLIAIVLHHKTPDNVAFWDFEKPNPTVSPLFQGDFLVGS